MSARFYVSLPFAACPPCMSRPSQRVDRGVHAVLVSLLVQGGDADGAARGMLAMLLAPVALNQGIRDLKHVVDSSASVPAVAACSYGAMVCHMSPVCDIGTPAAAAAATAVASLMLYQRDTKVEQSDDWMLKEQQQQRQQQLRRDFQEHHHFIYRIVSHRKAHVRCATGLFKIISTKDKAFSSRATTRSDPVFEL